jgi:hypothetical protein
MIHVRDILEAINLNERIQRLSESLDKLGNGALAAFAGGTVVLGLVAGGIFWMPAAMSGSLIGYRLARFWLARRDNKVERNLRRWDSIMLRTLLLRAAELPESDRKQLSTSLDRQLGVVEPILIARDDRVLAHREIEEVDDVRRFAEARLEKEEGEKRAVGSILEDRFDQEAQNRNAKAQNTSS